MKSPLLVLFLLSLGLNAVLGFFYLSQPSASGQTTVAVAANHAPAPAARTTQTEKAASSGTAEPAAIQWRTPRSDQDMHTLVANLRAAGFPPAAVRAMVNQMLDDRYAALHPGADLPFWKRNNLTPEMLATQQALNTERRDLYDALLGPDGQPAAVMDPSIRLQRYGNLSDDKLNAVARIERDYNDVRNAAYATNTSNAAQRGASYMEQQKMLEQEKMADLAAVLSPEELAQYEMRNSPSASRLMSNLKNVDINEAEYAALYQIQKSFDATQPSPINGSYTPEQMAQRTNTLMASLEQARAALPDERFYKLLENSDSGYARVAQFAAQTPGLTQATAYQLYQLQNEAQVAMMQAAGASRNSGPPSPQRMAELQTMAAGFETKLQTLLGPEAAEAYKKSPAGSMFRSMSRVNARGN